LRGVAPHGLVGGGRVLERVPPVVVVVVVVVIVVVAGATCRMVVVVVVKGRVMICILTQFPILDPGLS